MGDESPTPSEKRVESGIFPAAPGLDPLAAQLLQGAVVSFRARALVASGDHEAARAQLVLVYEAIDAAVQLGASSDDPRLVLLEAGAERLELALTPAVAQLA